MNAIVRLREEAERDLTEAASWYEQQQPGLGGAFLDATQATLDAIGKGPLHYPLVHRNTRRALIARFPFAVYFRTEERNIIVMAILHGSRHPAQWQTRR